jgi:SAM-dependent methyltransferase
MHAAGMDIGGWRRLERHSYRLGLRWLVGGRCHRWAGYRVGLCRLLIPLDPWRFWELGRITDEPFAGANLDVSSPKLLPSLLRREGRGSWIAIDLFADEIANWRWVDPDLDLRIDDARGLGFEDGTFDGCLCVSAIEHIPDDGDTEAMAAMWRVLRPNGTLHLTTVIANSHRNEMIDHKLYGDASEQIGEQVFYSRYYDDETLDERVLGLPWEVETCERVRQADRKIEATFYRFAPWTYPFGFVLRWLCPSNFAFIDSSARLADDEYGVVYLKLRKPNTDDARVAE